MDAVPAKHAGLYIHIPFCREKCRYCDFYSISDLSGRSRFLTALKGEMALAPRLPLVFDTLYIGGGTPSILENRAIGQILDDAAKCFSMTPDPEITLEINPGTVTLDSLRAYRRSGVNRLNIGVQSFDDNNLRFLGRIHSAGEARSVLGWARSAGFDNIGLDLIYGLPDQDKKNWLNDITAAIDVEPEHLSCYMLTCEPETPFGRDVKAGRIRLAAEETVLELFHTTIDFLTAHGFMQYEISNFARSAGPGHGFKPSRHNLKYWSFAPYIGLGPSAHSFIEPERWWNHRSLTRYLQQIESGKSPMAGKEKLTNEQKMIEAVYLGFRTAEGINLRDFKQRFGLDFLNAFDSTITDFKKGDLLNVTRTHCKLTRKGMALLDAVTAAFTNRDIA